jgi:pyruvate/2-oxoglutarate dehydrogenase complex dihydrolipoamide acyltransferase (E2) component
MRNVPGHFVRHNSSWRQIAPLVWGTPGDPSIYGIIDVDISSALPYLERRALESGVKLTLTHLVTRAVALTLRRHPECNAYVRWGRTYQRREVDIFVLVATNTDNANRNHAADLTGVKISGADKLELDKIAFALQKDSASVRHGKDDTIRPLKAAMRAFPGLVARVGLSAVTMLQYGFNVDLTKIGIPRDTFGGAIVSSMGMFGIRYGFAPLVPCMRLGCLIGIGRAEQRAVVIDGNVVIRTILPLTATLDHRVIDGYQAGCLASTLTSLLSDPEGAGL